MANDAKRRFWRKLGLQFGLGAIAGAAAALVFDHFLGKEDIGDAHGFGLLIGTALSYMGLVLLVASGSPAHAAKLMAQTLEPGEDFAAEMRLLRLQALVTLMAGVELLVLSWRTDLLTGAGREILLVGLLALALVQTWLNYRIWRRGDEFFRHVLIESAVVSFVLFQFILFAWAAGTRLLGLDQPSALDLYVFLMAVYLLVSFVVGLRRGYGVPHG